MDSYISGGEFTLKGQLYSGWSNISVSGGLLNIESDDYGLYAPDGNISITGGEAYISGKTQALKAGNSINLGGVFKTGKSSERARLATEYFGEKYIHISYNGNINPDEDDIPTILTIGSETVQTDSTGTGWTYDSSTKTLTLNDFKSTTKETVDGIESQIYADGDLNVVLEGTNELKTSSDYGLYCDGKLTVSGSGSLSCANVNTVAYASKDMDVTGTTITAVGDDTLLKSNGGTITLDAANLMSDGKIQSAEKIEIKGDTITSQTIESKTILLNGGTVNSNLSADALIEINDGVLNSTHMYVKMYNVLRVKGGEVNVIADSGTALDTNCSINFEGGDITIESPDGYAISGSQNRLEVSGGTINIKGNIDKCMNMTKGKLTVEGNIGAVMDSYISGGEFTLKGQLYSGWSNISVSGGLLNIESDDYGLYAPDGNISITGGEAYISGKTQALKAGNSINLGGGYLLIGNSSDNMNIADNYYAEKIVCLTSSYVFSWADDCKSCDLVITINGSNVISVPASITSKVKTEPTCVSKGTTTYTASLGNLSESKTLDDIDINLNNHVYAEWEILDPSCTKDGEKKKQCTLCGDEVKEVIPTSGHSWDEGFTIDTPATCTSDGLKSKHCTKCEEKKDVTVIPAKGHSFGDWVEVTPSTCEASGLKQHTCESCGLVESENLDPKGHDWEPDFTVDVEATCTKDGSKSIHCKNCEAVSSSTVIPATGHSYGQWKTTKEPTCIETGLKEKVCSACGDKITEELPIVDHSWNTNPTIDKAATCTEDGSQSIHCSVCGAKDESTVTVITATGHKWNTEYTVDKKATYAAAGSKSIHCSVCDAKKPNSAVSIPKLKLATPAVSKPMAAKKGFKVKWKKVSAATGYQVQYALNSKFTKSKKTVKITKAATVSKTVTKLKAKKKYYVRVRAYKVVSGKTYYSAWCKCKTVTTKK